MHISSAHQESLNVVLGRAPLFFAGSMVASLGSFAFFPLDVRFLAGGLVLGLLVAGLVLTSLRYYHFWLSWLIWVVPTTAILGAALVSVQTLRVESWQMMWQGLYIPFASASGTLWLSRKRFLKWLRER